MRKVLLDPKDVWEYFKDHNEELETTRVLIAENPELGVEIYLDSIQGLLHVEIVQDDYTIDEDCCTNGSDCEQTIQAFYDHLESGYYGREFDDVSDDDERDMEIEDREDELNRVFFDVLSTILDDKMDFYGVDEIVEDIKDRTIEYLARKYKLRIRRPMYLEDESGNDFFAEYPYEHMVYA